MNEGYYYRQPFQRCRSREIPTFGRPIGNNGWVECKSKSFPGKNYFFNVDSRCRTWERPVPSKTHTPVVKPLNLQSDDGFWDEISNEVSDLEDEEERRAVAFEIKQEEIDEKPTLVSFKEAKRREKFAEVLFKLYHCYGEDYNGNEIENLTLIEDTSLTCKSENIEDDWEENDSSIFPEICYSSSSEGESNDEFSRHSRNPAAAIYRENCEKCRNYYDRRGVSKNPRDFLEKATLRRFENSDFDDERISLDREIVGFGSRGKTRRDSGQFSREEDEDEEDEDKDEEDEENEEKFRIKKEKLEDSSRDEEWQAFLPRLKPLELTDLMTRRREIKLVDKKNQRRRRVTKKRKIVDEIPDVPRSRKVTKIIHEMNGVRTINYDFVAPELPPGVKLSNLSDTGSSSIDMARWGSDEEKSKKGLVRDADGPKLKSFLFPRDFFDIKEPRLSDSSTSGSSASSSSSSSSSFSKTATGTNNSSSSGSTSESDSGESSSSSSSSSSSTGNSSFGSISVDSSFAKVKKEPSSEISSSN